MRIRSITIKMYAVVAVLLIVFMITSSFAVAADWLSLDIRSSQSSGSGASGSTSGDVGSSQSSSSGASGSTSGSSGGSTSGSSGSSSSQSESASRQGMNNPPYAEANGPYFGITNQPIQFWSTGSYDPEGGPLDYYWEFGDGGTSTEADPVHSYSLSGDYTATLTVTDDSGYTATDTAQVTVNDPPVADADGPYSGETDEYIVFDGSGSYDPDGEITSWKWTFSDGTVKYGEIVTRLFEEHGQYTVELEVKDNEGATDTDVEDVTIADITVGVWPVPPLVNESVMFQAEVLGFVPGLYEWVFGDGNSNSSEEFFIYHTYSTTGVKDVSLTVSDDGVPGITHDFTIDIEAGMPGDNSPPNAGFTVTPESGVAGETSFSFESTSSDDDGYIILYEWDLDDNTFYYLDGEEINPPDHVYQESGGRTVWLTVTDNDLAAVSTSVYIDVDNPVGGASAPGNVPGGPVGNVAGQSSSSGSYSSGYSSGLQGASGSYLPLNMLGRMSQTSVGSLLFSRLIGIIMNAGVANGGSSGTGTTNFGGGGGECDFEISATCSPTRPEKSKRITFYITVTDKLGDYTGPNVRVHLVSDIPLSMNKTIGWESTPSNNGDVYFTWPDSNNQYYVTLTVYPYEGLGQTWTEIDWSDNSVTFNLQPKNTGYGMPANVPNGALALSESSSSSSSSSSVSGDVESSQSSGSGTSGSAFGSSGGSGSSSSSSSSSATAYGSYSL